MNPELKLKYEKASFEDILDAMGGFGKMQMIMFSLQCFLSFMYAGMLIGHMFITLAPPSHWCQPSPHIQISLLNFYLEETFASDSNRLSYTIANGNKSNTEHLLVGNLVLEKEEDILNFTNFLKLMTIPRDSNGEFEKCLMWDLDFQEKTPEALLSLPNVTTNTKGCAHGWSFDHSQYYPTISSELSWVCDSVGRKSLAESLFFVGSVVGGPLFGYLADKKGRKMALYASNVLAAISGTVIVFYSNFYFFSACSFFLGSTIISQINIIYILTMELVMPKYRNFVSNVPFMLFLTLGLTTVPWIAYALANWRYLSVIMYSPLVLVLLTHKFIPESVRWQLGKGRKAEATETLKMIAKTNGVEMTSELTHKLELFVQTSETLQNSPLIDVFKTPLLRKHFIGLCILMLSVRLLTDCHIRLSQVFEGSTIFVTVSVASALEMPAGMLAFFSADKLGRKMTIVVGFAMLFIGEGVLALTYSVNYYVQMVLYFTNKLFIVTILDVALMMPVEVLPTVVRSSGSSVVHSLSYMGAVASPFIVQTAHSCHLCGVGILCGVALLGGCASLLFLPETAGLKLPDTLQDGENLDKDNEKAAMKI